MVIMLVFSMIMDLVIVVQNPPFPKRQTNVEATRSDRATAQRETGFL